jgi:hypothetical protein
MSFAGIPISDFAPDTFITVERDEDNFTKQTGASGEVVRTRNNNRGGKVTFVLMAHSIQNDLLSAVAALDELSALGVAPFFLKELNGTSTAAAESAWIQKTPNMERAKEAGTVSWVLDCAELEMFSGGLS